MSQSLRFDCLHCGSELLMNLASWQLPGMATWNGVPTQCVHCGAWMVWRAEAAENGTMLWLEKKPDEKGGNHVDVSQV